jgi:hypothetical protein
MVRAGAGVRGHAEASPSAGMGGSLLGLIPGSPYAVSALLAG